MPTIGFIGNKLDLQIVQGATFGPHAVTLRNPNESPVNLTGATVRAQIRKRPVDGGDLVADVQCTITNAAQGQFSFEIADEVTAEFPAGEGQQDPAALAEWDMEMVDAAGRTTRLYYGTVVVYRGVSQP